MANVGQFLAVANECFDFDFDVYDNFDERCACAICPPVKLTYEGSERFLDALILNVKEFRINQQWGCCSLVVDCPTEHDAEVLRDFVLSAAGYCASDDYDKWFIED